MAAVAKTTGSAAPRWVLGTALALPVVLVAGVLIAAAVLRGQRPAPLHLAAIAAPAASSAECTRLLAAVPAQLDGGLGRRELAAPAPSGTVAWGDPAVVLRCGLPRPAQLTATSRLLDVSRVQFLELPDLESRSGPNTQGSSTWVAVDRSVYVVVTLPAQAGSGPLQHLAEVIAQALPARAVDVPR
ncbi:MAG TPA: DUF3515 domain-containing protein [Pseudonocardiaceae bacterium]|jgi:hypothetical protein|nr:DUF3515 domain-containing protein [Pseudonocardiaceae bacterium]